jgi:hypothetical protein
MTPFTSSTKKMNMIKATSLALVAAMLLSNAASATDLDGRDGTYPWCDETRFPGGTFIPETTEMTCYHSSLEECFNFISSLPRNFDRTCKPNPYYTTSLVGRFKNWVSGRFDDWEQSKKNAENRRLRKIAVECQASSATEAQTAACVALRTGRY